MRRVLTVLACTGVLVFAGAGTALARGPHHGPPVHYGYVPQRAAWNAGYRGGFGPHCGPPRTFAAYPAYPGYSGYPGYPVYGGPVYGSSYPQLGFGISGRNFSFFVAR